MQKTALVLRHVAFEDLGHFAAALDAASYAVRFLDIGLDPLDPADLAAADLLIVLGGPIGVCETDKYPFLSDEIEFVRQRLAAQKPILGICLGAQLMARALGSHVYPGLAKEIGFAPIQLNDAGRASCLGVFERTPVLHWHGDTFDLPAGATLLASTGACRHQAFSYGPNAIAFQFHPEAGAPGFERWLIGHTCELAAAGLSVPALRADYKQLAAQLATPAQECLRRWLAQLEA
jgi:GMP synthase (glutamine-hydrolysing)